MASRVDRWIRENAILLEAASCTLPPNSQIGELLDARIVFLGETNHFIHQKIEFRLSLIRALASRHRSLVLMEELGFSDGRRVAEYLFEGNDDALRRVATFGYEGFARRDRDDAPSGILGRSAYPYRQMLAEHARFYEALRRIPQLSGFFGIDLDAPGGGYDDIRRLDGDLATRIRRVTGESLIEEADRLEPFIESAGQELREDLQSMIESLRYTAMIQHARDFDALRPAMAYREESMKRRFVSIREKLSPDDCVVLMGHAFHLAKNDDKIESVGVGPGGDRVPSLGHFIVNGLDERVASVWMLYGDGRDSQPLEDLPRVADFPRDTLNAQIAHNVSEVVLIPLWGAPRELANATVGHLYNAVVEVDVLAEADAIMFFPEVTPLEGDTRA